MAKKTAKRQESNRQLVAADWMRENYLQNDRLRLDIVRDKLQQVQLDSPGEVPMLQWRDLTDRDINDMVCACAAETGVAVTDKEILTVLHSSAVAAIHPLRDYIYRQAPYDPKKEPNFIRNLSDMVHLTDTNKHEWWRECFLKWFLGMVAGWLQDDAVNQQVLVLIGKQGIYKTTWLERLLPPELSGFGSKFNGIFDKDDRLRLAEFGLLNMDEIDAMTPRELNKMKSLITAIDINERGSYKHLKERRLRMASFCASGNKREFLSDITGNRRWLAFEVENIDDPFLLMPLFPYGRLYAQARYMLEELHYEYWFRPEDIAKIEAQNSDFRACESEEQLLPVLFDIPADGGVGGQVKFLTTAQISQILVDYGSIKRPMALNRLSTLMTKMGFQRVRKGKQRIVGWIVYQRNTDEIQRLEHNV